MMTAPLDVGLHYDVPSAVYHSDPCPSPSLSSSCARTILARSIEHAALEHPRLGGKKRESTPAMGLGSIVHGQLAGEQSDYVLGTYDNYRSGAAQAWRDAVTATGKTPVLERDVEAARPIVEAIRAKAGAGISNNPFAPHGRNEVTAIWKEGDVYCRARYDRVLIDPAGYLDVWDWKTCQDASPDKIMRAIIDHDYHIQEAFYKRGLAKVLPQYAGRISFNFVFVEVAPPYAVRRVCLSEGFHSIGDVCASRAIREWQAASKSGQWSDATAGETLIMQPPDWYVRKLEEAA